MNAKSWKRLSIFLVVIIGIIIIDQITKNWVMSNFYVNESKSVINGFFSFTYVRNPGAAFGFLANVHDAIRKPLIFFIPVAFCLAMPFLFALTWKKNILLEIAYALIFAGAVGNLIDRFTLNYVVDFLDFYLGKQHFPAFNVADSAISIAAVVLVIDLIFNEFRKKGNKQVLNLKDD